MLSIKYFSTKPSPIWAIAASLASLGCEQSYEYGGFHTCGYITLYDRSESTGILNTLNSLTFKLIKSKIRCDSFNKKILKHVSAFLLLALRNKQLCCRKGHGWWNLQTEDASSCSPTRRQGAQSYNHKKLNFSNSK